MRDKLGCALGGIVLGFLACHIFMVSSQSEFDEFSTKVFEAYIDSFDSTGKSYLTRNQIETTTGVKGDKLIARLRWMAFMGYVWSENEQNWNVQREGLEHYNDIQGDKVQWRRSLVYGAVTFILGYLAAWLGERKPRDSCRDC